MSVTGRMHLQHELTVKDTVGLGTTSSGLRLKDIINWTDGGGVDQINKVFHDDRNLADGANETLDLAGGGLTDPLNVALTFTAVKLLYIKNESATQTLTIGNATNPWQGWISALGTIILPPLGRLMLVCPSAAGWAVTAATADSLKIANSAGDDVDYTILIAGD